MKNRIKAGLAMLTAEWFEQTGLDVVEDPDLNIVAMAKNNAKEAIKTLSKHFDLVHTDLITTVKDAKNACDEYRRENVDIIILTNLIYSGDDTIIEIAQQMKGKPFLLWSFHPDKKLEKVPTMARYFRVTGAAGMMQGVAPLKRLNVNPGFVLGAPGDEELDRKLENYAKAYEVYKSLKELQIAAIGRRYEPMTGSWIDEFRLKTQVGPRVNWISAKELIETAKALPQDRINEFIADQKSKYEVVDIPDDAMEAAARASIACYELCHKYGCEVCSVQDMDEEIHEGLGVRPQMSYPPMFEEGICAGMEEDIDSALCVWIVQNLMNSVTMYGETFTYSEEDNYLVIGHASMHDLSLAGDNEITLVHDGEFDQSDRYVGVWDEFICKPGDVTLCCLFEDNDRYKFLVCSGTSLKSEKWVPGNVHSLIRLNMPLEEFFEDTVEFGATQHFAMCYGDAKKRIKILAKLLNFEYIDMDENHRYRSIIEGR